MPSPFCFKDHLKSFTDFFLFLFKFNQPTYSISIQRVITTPSWKFSKQKQRNVMWWTSVIFAYQHLFLLLGRESLFLKEKHPPLHHRDDHMTPQNLPYYTENCLSYSSLTVSSFISEGWLIDLVWVWSPTFASLSSSQTWSENHIKWRKNQKKIF